jgi:hypothetical protein
MSARDNDIISGFDHYRRIAYKNGLKFGYAKWFNDKDDFLQATALAAATAINELGESTTLKQLSALTNKVIYLQAKDYGLRNTTEKSGQTKTLKRELNAPDYAFEGKEDTTILIGKFTRDSAYLLHQVNNLPDHEEPAADPRIPMIRQLAESDPMVATLCRWLEHQEHMSYKEIVKDGVLTKSQAERTLHKMREVLGECKTQHQEEQAARFAQLWNESEIKSAYHLAKVTGISKTTIVKYIRYAKAKGLIAYEELAQAGD